MHGSGETRLTRIVQCQIEVIRRRAVDRAVCVVADLHADVYRNPTSSEIPQHESEGHPLAQWMHVRRGVVEARQDHPVVRRDAGDRVQGEEQRRCCRARREAGAASIA